MKTFATLTLHKPNFTYWNRKGLIDLSKVGDILQPTWKRREKEGGEANLVLAHSAADSVEESAYAEGRWVHVCARDEWNKVHLTSLMNKPVFEYPVSTLCSLEMSSSGMGRWTPTDLSTLDLDPLRHHKPLSS